MQIKRAKDANGVIHTFGLASDKDGNQKWVNIDDPMVDTVAPSNAPILDNKPSVPVSDTEETARRKAAVNMPFWPQDWSMLGSSSSSRPPDRLTTDLKELASNNNPFLSQKEIDANKTKYKEYDEEKGVADHIVQALPYVAIEGLANPITSKIANRAVSILGDKVGPLFSKFNYAKGIPVQNATRRTMVGDFLGGATTGAAEGALDNNRTASDGILSSISGNAMAYGSIPGKLPDLPLPGADLSNWIYTHTMPEALKGLGLKNSLERAPSQLTASTKEIVDDLQNRGFRTTPGERLGIEDLQAKEHGFTNHSGYSPYMTDLANNRMAIMNRDAYKTMGMDLSEHSPNGYFPTTEQLKAHLDGIGKQYDDIEHGVTGFIPANILSDLEKSTRDTFSSLPMTDNNVIAKSEMTAWTKHIKQMQQKAGSTGTGNAAVPNNIEGPVLVDLKKQLKNDISSAYAKGNRTLAEGLKTHLDVVNNAIVDGIVRKGGTSEEGLALLAKYKDLDSKFAMGNILLNHGTEMGSFSPKKMDAYFTTSDPRYNTGAPGMPIDELFRLARQNKLDKVQSGSNMSGLNLHQAGLEPQSTENSLLMTPLNQSKMPILRRKKMELYMDKGWPRETGYLGLSGDGWQNPALYTRALAQEQQTSTKIRHAATGLYDWTKDKYDNPINLMDGPKSLYDYLIHK